MKRSVLGRSANWQMVLLQAALIAAVGASMGEVRAVPPSAVCGNGIAEPGEGCDPGDPQHDPDFRGKTCQTEGFDGGLLICTVDCKVRESACFCGSGAVPATGQTDCWNSAGAPIDCTGTGQDGAVQAGISTQPRFTDHGDGTITDHLTGLIWLRNAFCFGERSWQDALDDANALADGACGLNDGSAVGDWRLPNLKELQSLIDYGRFHPALPPLHPFVNVVPNGSYWSSTTIDDDNFTRRAWVAIIGFGGATHVPKTELLPVWPVRGGV